MGFLLAGVLFCAVGLVDSENVAMWISPGMMFTMIGSTWK